MTDSFLAWTATVDFETRSACDLKDCGSWKYSLDPTTEILCLAFRLPHWQPGRTGLWQHPGLTEQDGADLTELFDWISGGGLVEAHNAFFERGIWTNVAARRHGFPLIPHTSWRCSAAKAAAHGLPRGLDDALAALGLDIRKDAEGSKVMRKMSKPRPPRKAEREAGVTGLLWWDTPELREQLYAYCRQDVLAEEALSAALPDLFSAETEVYLLDQAMNERGFQLDVEAVTTALRLIERETDRLNSELRRLTDGKVETAGQRARLKAWLKEAEGVDLEDTTKATVAETLGVAPLTERGTRVLTILSTLGRSSTAKYEAMAAWMDATGRVRGGLLYHGATTGRWSGAGVQPHNFPRGSWDHKAHAERFKDQEVLWQTLKSM